MNPTKVAIRVTTQDTQKDPACSDGSYPII